MSVSPRGSRAAFRDSRRRMTYLERRLLLGDDRVLDGLAQAELERGLGRNLYRFAGLRVAALARLALGENHLAEAGKLELAVLLDLAGGKVRQLLENFLDLRPLQLEFFGE